MFAKCCIVFLIFATANADKLEEFNMRPNQPESKISITDEGLTCTFEYVCTGGSSEIWQMSIYRDAADADVVHCTLGRPQPPSYLQFKNFNAGFQRKKLLSAAVEGSAGPLLESDNIWTVKSHKVTVGDNWTSQQIFGIHIQTKHRKNSKKEEL
eukprot:TRINITY_DN22666_c0_g1_i1.p1 TRINITY_DN22666_c0_g1~~TRINITY_DN22666_c0_g1_i1.p1  ORF type:complete len:154 (-),score=8.62 TRINITY_DN22666_c0_g1_i1:99-560(-)